MKKAMAFSLYKIRDKKNTDMITSKTLLGNKKLILLYTEFSIKYLSITVLPAFYMAVDLKL